MEIKRRTAIRKRHFQFLKEERITEKYASQESEEADDKSNDVEYGAVWIRDVDHEQEDTMTGSFLSVIVENNTENQLDETYNKRRRLSAGNDWRRKIPDMHNRK